MQFPLNAKKTPRPHHASRLPGAVSVVANNKNKMNGLRLNRPHHSPRVYRRIAPHRTVSSSASASSPPPSRGAVAWTLRLLLVALAVVALFIMLFNLSFAYTRLENHHSNRHPGSGGGGGIGRRRRRRQYWYLGLSSSSSTSSSSSSTNSLFKTQKKNRKQQQHREEEQDLKNPDCQVIATANDMVRCYRPDLSRRLQHSLHRLPSHCRTDDNDDDKNNNNNHHDKKMKKKNATATSYFLLHNWTQLQSCLTKVPSRTTTTTSTPIHTIHILGERHSGTKLVQQELQRCFPRSSTFRIHRDLDRSKHFFQPLIVMNDHDNNDPGSATTTATNTTTTTTTTSRVEDYRHSLVIAMFRDPLDWTEAMRLKPYHAPFHMASFVGTPQHNDIQPLDWKSFVTKPWTMPRDSKYDLRPATTMTHNNNNNNINNNNSNHRNATQQHSCRYGFSQDEIIPCLFNPDSNFLPANRLRGFEPIYELTRTVVVPRRPNMNNQHMRKQQQEHQEQEHRRPPFDNVLHLRSEKIRHLALEVPLLLPNLGGYLPLRYEDLLQSGLQPVVDWVSQSLNLTSTCPTSSQVLVRQQQQHKQQHKQQPPPPQGQGRRVPQRPPIGPQPHLLHNRQANMPLEQKEWIQSHLFVPMEQLLGYFQFVPTDEVPQ